MEAFGSTGLMLRKRFGLQTGVELRSNIRV